MLSTNRDKKEEETERINERGRHSQCSKFTNGTFIHVLVAGSTNKASRAGADGAAVQRVSVTHCPLITGVTDTSIIQMTEQTCRNSRM